MTCEQALDFEQRSNDLWLQWEEKSDTEDPVAWDAAFEWYTARMEALRQEFGRPAGRPRPRPRS